ncbi:DUF3027 domain-containing protein [Arthrobacter sp. MMS18-M83]|uniref:DUF3027 domain-containing protein n=1 Tax=Arthrobacter sp. MMS18-M83 TaxID=2996261 RepID=UPI00227C68DE|nr:DUF3027 domain-containing protein [Arthrobacter sp. MMS18-M83]WAH99007.1 DUF3027 domain-containing protein [Arthrobacter sp. MMS18-M83]
MTSESAEASPEENGTGAAPATAGTADTAAGRKLTAAKPRTGIPMWRVGKPDAFLAAAVDVARNAVESIAKPNEIGPHIAARSEGERVVTHLFESRLAGYGGWQWYAVVTRNSRSKVVTVSELGLLPSEDSILAPEWVPWAKRVRPEDEAGPDELAEEDTSTADGSVDEDEDTPDDDGAPSDYDDAEEDDESEVEAD